MSVTLRLADDLDISRGDLIASAVRRPDPDEGRGRPGLLAVRPRPASGARRCCSSTPPEPCRRSSPRSGAGSTWTPSAPVEAEALTLNDIGRVSIRLAAPIVAEDYTDSRRTGAFLLIDPQTGSTLAAGMIRSGIIADDFDAETLNWSI